MRALPRFSYNHVPPLGRCQAVASLWAIAGQRGGTMQPQNPHPMPHVLSGASGDLPHPPRSTGGGLLTFLALSFAVTWSAFIAAANWVPAQTAAGYALVLFGAYTPGFVALSLTAMTQGRRGVLALLRRILIADVPLRLYIMALTYIAVVKVTAAILHRLLAGTWPPFAAGSMMLIPFAIALSTPFQAGEEIGWRGFALPRLADRFGLRIASVLLGVIWAIWHLPQFYIAAADTYHQSFVVWAPQVVALSVALAWLYAKSGGSLLLVMLLHSAINNSKDIVGSAGPVPPGVFSPNASLMAWLTLILLWIAAAYFLARMPAKVEWRV
jgi:membrane protease YdiL (CAAX protease family)